MKKVLLLILLLPLISIGQKTEMDSVQQFQQSTIKPLPTAFSGKWNINIRKTDYGQAPEWILPKAFEINQKKDAIVIQSKAYDKQMIQHYYTETISFDGTTSETITWSGNKRIVSMMRWSYADKSFELSVRIISDDGKSSPGFTETWSLENDGKTLIVNRRATQADDYSVKAYYEKGK